MDLIMKKINVFWIFPYAMICANDYSVISCQILSEGIQNLVGCHLLDALIWLEGLFLDFLLQQCASSTS